MNEIPTPSTLAVVNDEATAELPQDLYIPPNALRVFLETFEGPLDLLLYLIRKQNLDILSLPIAKITDQYIRYIELMQKLEIELAAEYLLMVAILAEIKSRMLLPRHEQNEDDEESDPRADLVRRLIEYERIKDASENLDAMPRSERETYEFEIACEGLQIVKPLPQVQLEELANAYRQALAQAALHRQHRIMKEPLLVSDRINLVLKLLDSNRNVEFQNCFVADEGEAGVVVAFLALLELLKAGMITVVQSGFWSPIYLRRR
ncbi:MAG: segregation/condensation protein A [Gammaproteobacteria bacterium]|nr:segregation/condensation protein A [Gammaproteobacteria bacterium]